MLYRQLSCCSAPKSSFRPPATNMFPELIPRYCPLRCAGIDGPKVQLLVLALYIWSASVNVLPPLSPPNTYRRWELVMTALCATGNCIAVRVIQVPESRLYLWMKLLGPPRGVKPPTE